MIALSRKKWTLHPQAFFYIFGGAYLLVAIIELAGYIPWTSVNFILGMIGLPFTMTQQAPEQRAIRKFYFIAFIFGVLSFFIPLKTVLFVAMVAAILSIAEGIRGEISLLSILTLMFMSPTLQYLAGIFSFPIRLQLTSRAGWLLNFTGKAAITAGNVITYGGHDYSVDPACMGLKMLLTSLLCGIFIIAIYQKKLQKNLGSFRVLLILSLVFVLNLLSNIIRILVLVFFDIRPENKMHEFTGLACLVIYVLLPATWVIQRVIKWKGREMIQKPVPAVSVIAPGRLTFFHGSLLVLLLCSCVSVNLNSHGASQNLPAINGYTAAYYDSDVLQYKNINSLVYIKKIDGVFCSEHNPVMCWLGSGYLFESINESTIGDSKIYTGTLNKGKEKLYTAWWYDNGKDRTLGQFDWRWKVIKGGRQYSVINVTAASEAELVKEVDRICRENVFKAAL